MLGGLGWQELLIVLVIIMIIFGAGKLPEISKSLAQGVREFREVAQSPVIDNQINSAATSSVVEKASAKGEPSAREVLFRDAI